MTEFVVSGTHPKSGEERTTTLDSRSAAEERADEMRSLLDDVTVQEATTDGGKTAEVVDDDPREGTPTEPAPAPAQEAEALDQLGEELENDPLDILPSHMIDTIQGQPAVNKRGYSMIAERYGISATADIKQYPWDNDENRCVAKATAVTSDGTEYSGWATACADDGDMADNIIELAETRSLKRSIAMASGVGIVSYQELSNQLE